MEMRRPKDEVQVVAVEDGPVSLVVEVEPKSLHMGIQRRQLVNVLIQGNEDVSHVRGNQIERKPFVGVVTNVFEGFVSWGKVLRLKPSSHLFQLEEIVEG
jgi:hypothetical protein